MLKRKVFLCRSFYHIFVSLNMSLSLNSKVTLLCIDDQLNREKLEQIKSRISFLFENIDMEIISKDKRSYLDFLNIECDEIYFFHWVIYKRPEYDFYKRYRSKGICLIEDGTTHYGVYQNDFKTGKIYIKHLINYILVGKRDFVLSKYVKDVYASLPDKYPDYIKAKIKKLNYSKKIGEKTKEKLLKIFDLDLSNLNLKNRELAIIFTQPLSEDGFILEREKISIYTQLVKQLREEGYTILFKQHPREKTYYDLAGEIIKLDQHFPGEILDYLDLDIKKAIAVCSGVIHNIKAYERIQLDPDFFSKSKKKVK